MVLAAQHLAYPFLHCGSDNCFHFSDQWNRNGALASPDGGRHACDCRYLCRHLRLREGSSFPPSYGHLDRHCGCKRDGAKTAAIAPQNIYFLNVRYWRKADIRRVENAIGHEAWRGRRDLKRRPIILRLSPLEPLAASCPTQPPLR